VLLPRKGAHQLADEASAALTANTGIWCGLQPFPDDDRVDADAREVVPFSGATSNQTGADLTGWGVGGESARNKYGAPGRTRTSTDFSIRF
jgi:hypothetical protein